MSGRTAAARPAGTVTAPRRPGSRRVLAGVAVALLAAAPVAACTEGGDPAGGGAGPAPSGPFADCAGLTGSPAAPASGGEAPAGERFPALSLPCFTGGGTVDTGQLRGPALVNLWASWCGPCRQELPALQRFADRAGPQVRVVGVVSRDDAGSAGSLATELGVTFPTLYDRQGDLMGRIGRAALPVTVFVDAAGRISYIYNAEPLDDAALADLAGRYLGVGGQ